MMLHGLFERLAKGRLKILSHLPRSHHLFLNLRSVVRIGGDVAITNTPHLLFSIEPPQLLPGTINAFGLPLSYKLRQFKILGFLVYFLVTVLHHLIKALRLLVEISEIDVLAQELAKREIDSFFHLFSDAEQRHGLNLQPVLPGQLVVLIYPNFTS